MISRCPLEAILGTLGVFLVPREEPEYTVLNNDTLLNIPQCTPDSPPRKNNQDSPKSTEHSGGGGGGQVNLLTDSLRGSLFGVKLESNLDYKMG